MPYLTIKKDTLTQAISTYRHGNKYVREQKLTKLETQNNQKKAHTIAHVNKAYEQFLAWLDTFQS